MQFIRKIEIIIFILAFVSISICANDNLFENFNSYYGYRKVLNAKKSPDEIAKEFIQDSVQGSVLKEKNITLEQFQSMLKDFEKTNTGVNFHISISESEYQNLLQQQNNKIDRDLNRESKYRQERATNSDESNSCVSGKSHPFYGDYKFGENHQTNFLKDFDPNKLPKLISKDPSEFANALKPHDKTIPFNSEQIMKGKEFSIDRGYYGALNMNADLGLQYTIEKILQPNILIQRDSEGKDKPSYVIISSGHAIAGLASLAKLTSENSKNKCLFDTSIYMPMGTWLSSTRMNVATQGAAIWAQSISNSKKKCTSYAGGVAIALNGHRGDFDLNNIDQRAANINAQEVFGSPDEFIKNLKKRGLSRVVVITETMVDSPSKENKFTLEILQSGDSPTFNAANRDLYDFLKSVKEKGIEVIVVSGEQRVNHCTKTDVKGPESKHLQPASK